MTWLHRVPAKEARGAVEKDEENDEEKSDRESINDDPGEVATEAPMQNEPKTIDGEGGVLGATENFAVGKRDEAVVKTKPLELENDASEVDSDDACIANKPETEDLDDEVGDVDMAQASGGEQGTDVMVQVAAGVGPPSPLTDIPRENENESDGGSAENRSKTEQATTKAKACPRRMHATEATAHQLNRRHPKSMVIASQGRKMRHLFRK